MGPDFSTIDLLALLPTLRFLKLVGVAMFFAGGAGALLSRNLEDQRRLAFLLGGPGFGVTWLAGFLMAAALGVNVLQGWVLGAIGLSLVAVQGMMFVVMREGRRGAGASLVVMGSILGCVALMVFRP